MAHTAHFWSPQGLLWSPGAQYGHRYPAISGNRTPVGGWLCAVGTRWITTAQPADKILMMVRTTPRDRVKKPSQGLSLF
ncbi:hypothetical protein N7527_012248 [Penicillium freii]|nr:hypothetical protein N7527_012248 [Penicillium freii]